MEHTTVFSKKNSQWLTVFLIVLSAFFFFKVLQTIKEYKVGSIATNQISITGTGEAFAVPNIAEITFTVEKEAKTVKEAQDFVNTKTKEALDFLKSKNIADKDIKTINDSFAPQYDYTQTPCTAYGCLPGKSTIRGYQASRSFSVKVRAADAAGDISQGLGNLAVSNLTGPNFVVDEDDAVKAEARTKAIANAKEKADQIAKDLGIKVKRVVSFYEDQPYMTSRSMMESKSMDMTVGSAAAPMLPTGENKYVSTVTVVFEIR